MPQSVACQPLVHRLVLDVPVTRTFDSLCAHIDVFHIRELITQMLAVDPENRPAPEELINGHFMRMRYFGADVMRDVD